VRTWIMVAGLIGGFYAPTVVAGGYVTARLSRAGFVGLSDFIGGKIEAVFFAVDGGVRCLQVTSEARSGPPS